jgi:hypothetical protein
MKRRLLQVLKFINVALGFMTCLYLISKSLGMFALTLALFITYLNIIIDEILKGSDKTSC